MIEKKQKSKTPAKPKSFGKTVYIGNMSYKRDEEGIRWLFSPFGSIRSVDIVMEPGTNKSKGYAFVKMNRSEDAQKAIAALNGSVVDNRTLKVSEAEERAEFKQSNKSLDKKSTTPKSKKAKEEKEDDVIESVRKKKKKYSGLDELKKYLKKK